MATPLIAITADRSIQSSAFGPRDSTLQVVNYAEAVVSAGGRPALLPATEGIEGPLLEGFDALVLSGGGDLSPGMYGQTPDEAVYGLSPIRDRFESALVQEAQERRMPILAICRGLQLINVLRGGSLIQDLAGHWQTGLSHEPDHDIRIEPGSRLAEIVGDTRMSVNSYHHQAVDRLGDGLMITAYADGIVEAFEDPSADLLAVQWHPEHLYASSVTNHALFDDVVQRAHAFKERTAVNA